MKQILLFLFFPFSLATVSLNTLAQPRLSLQQAYSLAQQHYPVIRQRELIQQTTGFTLENLNKGYLPQFGLSGQATYQSEVTGVQIPLPGISIASVNKDQYKFLADINQLIYDGGMIKEQKNIQRLQDAAEQQKVEVELYKLKERINQLFLGVLYLDELLKQVALIKADLNTGIKKVEAQVQYGIAYQSNLNVLKAELLKTEQRYIELKANRKGLYDVLALFINQPLSENTILETPQPEWVLPLADLQRPELKLFSMQEKLLGGQYRLVDSKLKPKAGWFFQGGYGKPGLNFLKNEFSFFYLSGIRFQWSFGGLYTQKREKKLIELSQQNVKIQKELFLLNTNAQLKQQQAEIEKLFQLIDADKGIIELRTKIKEAAKAQLENGVITANDYVREVTAEDLARQSLITHQVQLLQAQITYQTLAGK